MRAACSYGFVLPAFLFLQVYYMVNCSIICEPGESADSLWRRFRKASDRANVYRDYARSREFISRSQRRAVKSSRARAKVAKYNVSN